jgi:hypothetical protein
VRLAAGDVEGPEGPWLTGPEGEQVRPRDIADVDEVAPLPLSSNTSGARPGSSADQKIAATPA